MAKKAGRNTKARIVAAAVDQHLLAGQRRHTHRLIDLQAGPGQAVIGGVEIDRPLPHDGRFAGKQTGCFERRQRVRIGLQLQLDFFAHDSASASPVARIAPGR